jgi:hypothetical protein
MAAETLFNVKSTTENIIDNLLCAIYNSEGRLISFHNLSTTSTTTSISTTTGFKTVVILGNSKLIDLSIFNTIDKIRRHFPSIDFFQLLEKQMPRKSRIFIVTYKDKVIGGSVCIYSNDSAYLWFSGGMRKTYALQYPGILAVWQALRDAKERGYRHLEFMDVGLPFHKHGYREFVLRFGGKQISTRRWFRFRWEWLNRVLIKMYE